MENKYKKKTDRLAYWCQFVQLFRQKILDATPVSLYEDVSTLAFTLVRGESWGGKKEKKKKKKKISLKFWKFHGRKNEVYEFCPFNW